MLNDRCRLTCATAADATSVVASADGDDSACACDASATIDTGSGIAATITICAFHTSLLLGMLAAEYAENAGAAPLFTHPHTFFAHRTVCRA
jgi:hypothetical protein